MKHLRKFEKYTNLRKKDQIINECKYNLALSFKIYISFKMSILWL